MLSQQLCLRKIHAGPFPAEDEYTPLGEADGFIRVFMQPTEHIRAVAPGIIRRYGISFLLLPLNVFSTYYFQAVLRPKTSFAVSVLRGALISGILILALPGWFGADALWFAMPITELLMTLYVLPVMIRRAK